MKVDTFDFGCFEHVDERTLVIVINEGVVIDGELSRKLVGLIDEALDQPSVLIIDRRNDYSYSGTGLVTLKDSNLPNVAATGIVDYGTIPEGVADTQINVMNRPRRSNLNVFSSLDHALHWASELLAKATDTIG